jgi:hypothetical protein
MSKRTSLPQPYTHGRGPAPNAAKYPATPLTKPSAAAYTYPRGRRPAPEPAPRRPTWSTPKIA